MFWRQTKEFCQKIFEKFCRKIKNFNSIREEYASKVKLLVSNIPCVTSPGSNHIFSVPNSVHFTPCKTNGMNWTELWTEKLIGIRWCHGRLNCNCEAWNQFINVEEIMSIIYERYNWIIGSNFFLTFIGTRLLLLALGSRIIIVAMRQLAAGSHRAHGVTRRLHRNFIQIGKCAGSDQPQITHAHLQDMFGQAGFLHFERPGHLFDFIVKNCF